MTSPVLLVDNASEIGIPDPDGRRFLRLKDHAMFISAGRIGWLGPRGDIPSEARRAAVHDAQCKAVMPALVDCHTHLVYGGDRLADFVKRASGVTYAEILKAGGGIQTTVKRTRETSTQDLIDAARRRLLHRRRYGIVTSEVKSGYGLSVEEELRLLRVVHALRREGYDVEPTLLAAHAYPPEGTKEAYVQAVIEELIPKVATEGLATSVDAFVEQGAYSIDDARHIFAAAKAHGLGLRLHADQLSHGGGTELCASMGALSADHIEHATDADLDRLAKANVVATLLPGAMTFLGDSGRNLGPRLRAAGARIAIATDHNPGSSPLHNLPLCATLAVTQMGVTVDEALCAITLGGAKALGRSDIGTLAPGARGRFLILDDPDCRSLIYAFGEPMIRACVACDLKPSLRDEA